MGVALTMKTAFGTLLLVGHLLDVAVVITQKQGAASAVVDMLKKGLIPADGRPLVQSTFLTLSTKIRVILILWYWPLSFLCCEYLCNFKWC
jgi:hypothetical protein